jgi:Protein of unknown function (DUF3450)
MPHRCPCQLLDMKRFLLLLLSLAAPGAACAGGARGAHGLEASIDVQAAAVAEAVASQARIDQVNDKTQALLAEYREVTRESESLKRYDDHLERMVGAQGQATGVLEKQLEEIAVTKREVIPLMSRMVESLSRFIELDVPFHLETRRRRAQRLRELIDAPEQTVAEKYQRILEAYRSEIEYGRTLEAYRGTLTRAGHERSVEFLRLGRIVFIYRTLDGSEAGIWSQGSRAWTDLPDADHSALDMAFRVARKQAAPELLQLPVSAPEPAS